MQFLSNDIFSPHNDETIILQLRSYTLQFISIYITSVWEHGNLQKHLCYTQDVLQTKVMILIDNNKSQRCETISSAGMLLGVPPDDTQQLPMLKAK